MLRHRASIVLGGALLALPLVAADVKVFVTQSQSAFLQGTLEDISVEPLGVLRLAHQTETLASIDEPFLLSAAAHGEGWIVGTGNAGRVFEIDQDGAVELLFETEEPEVFAVFASEDGTIWAGSSPDGKVYRYRDGEVTVAFDPGQTYIWDLRTDPEGNLLVATGTEGKLFRMNRDGEGALLYDSEDTHLRSLAVLGDGTMLVGTAGQGLLLRLSPQGEARTLHDAAAPELVAFATDPEGGTYFAVLASEASFVNLGSSGSRESQGNGSEQDDEEEENGADDIEVSASAETPVAGSRPPGFAGARSEVLLWRPANGIESVWKFSDETVYALHWQDGRLWVATGLDGKLYSYQNEQMILEKEVDESQIVALLPGPTGPVFATTNAAALYWFTEGKEKRGILTSDVFDAGATSRFGTLHWRGDTPPRTAVRFSFRGGMSAGPDDTWTPWSEPLEGREISLRDLASNRYFQWRAELLGEGDLSPEVRSVEVSYLQANQRPEIERVDVMDPGQILVPGNFNPSNQVFEPAHPTREGIFTTLGDTSGREPRGWKTLWKKGYRTLRWRARDPNEDKLSYSITFRREDDPEGWLDIVKDLDEERYSFDATVLPDGHYRFRVTASDAGNNLASEAMTASKLSDVVVIDHTPPVIQAASRRDGRIEVTVKDSLNILREAVISVDAGTWKEASVADGLLDSREETLHWELGQDARLLLLRVTDAAFNTMTYDLSGYLP